MAGFFRKSLGRGVHRNRRDGSDGKTWAFFDAGARLLARYDYDQVSMARLAKEAGCSVGALYSRFPEKETFLHRLAIEAFLTLRDDAKLVLDRGRWRRESVAFIVNQMMRHVVARMTARRAAGVIRMAIKLGATRTSTRELFEDYRKEATERAVQLLSPKLGYGGASRVRTAMQIVFATVTDAVLHKKPGPLQAGSARMIDALSNMKCGYLGVAGEDWAGDEADGEDEPIDEIGSETEPKAPPGYVSLYDPDLRVYRGFIASPDSPRKHPRISHTRRGNGKTHVQSSNAEPEEVAPKVVKPPRVPTPPPEPEPNEPPPVRKRRKVFI